MYINRDYQPRRKQKGIFARFWPLFTLLALGVIFYETQPEWLFNPSTGPTPTPTLSAISYIAEAERAELAGNYDQVIAAYQQVAKLEVQNPKPLVKLSEIYLFMYGMADTSKAYEYAKQALERAPQDPEALAAYARVLDWQLEYDEAASYALDSQDLDPDNPTTLAILGEIYNDIGRPDQAQDFVDQALALDPQNVLALRTQAQLFERTQDYAKSIEMFDKAIAAAPHRFDLYIEKARSMRFGLNDYEGSVVVLQKAAEIYPSAVTLAALGEGLNLLGDNFQAARKLRDAVELDPEYGPAQVQLGMALYARRNYEDAAIALEKGISLLPNPESARIENIYSLGLSYVYQEPQECDKAVPWLKKAIETELAATGQLSGPALQGLRSCGKEYLSNGEIN